jgi:hypothetical protein
MAHRIGQVQISDHHDSCGTLGLGRFTQRTIKAPNIVQANIVEAVEAVEVVGIMGVEPGRVRVRGGGNRKSIDRVRC